MGRSRFDIALGKKRPQPKQPRTPKTSVHTSMDTETTNLLKRALADVKLEDLLPVGHPDRIAHDRNAQRRIRERRAMFREMYKNVKIDPVVAAAIDSVAEAVAAPLIPAGVLREVSRRSRITQKALDRDPGLTGRVRQTKIKDRGRTPKVPVHHNTKFDLASIHEMLGNVKKGGRK